MDNVVKIGAVLDTIKTLKDGSFKISFESGELPSEVGAKLLDLRRQYGWLLFCPETNTEIEIPTEPPREFKQDKTPSQRLRSVLYIWWTQLGSEGDFEVFYREKMEATIDHVKGKLD